jgi:hypothetical protein
MHISTRGIFLWGRGHDLLALAVLVIIYKFITCYILFNKKREMACSSFFEHTARSTSTIVEKPIFVSLGHKREYRPNLP